MHDLWHDFRKTILASLTAAMVLGTAPVVAKAQPAATSYDWYVCADEARRLEIWENIPKLLLTAVTFTETGRRGPAGRKIMSWPWTLHAQGKSLLFNSKADAAAAVRSLMARGINNIDVGCMQINLRYHPHAFTSVEEALDPNANLAYGVAYLKKLKNRHKGWPTAIQHYHSANKAVNVRYRRKVLTTWDHLRRRQERQRLRSGTSVLASSAHGDKQRLSASTPTSTNTSVLARRENRRSWTIEKRQTASVMVPWQDALVKHPLSRLPFKSHRPHAHVLVALDPWGGSATEEQQISETFQHPRTAKRRILTLVAQTANQLGE